MQSMQIKKRPIVEDTVCQVLKQQEMNVRVGKGDIIFR
jgi:hypothetical protein